LKYAPPRQLAGGWVGQNAVCTFHKNKLLLIFLTYERSLFTF
jgi:hypothetical protein